MVYYSDTYYLNNLGALGWKNFDASYTFKTGMEYYCAYYNGATLDPDSECYFYAGLTEATTPKYSESTDLNHRIIFNLSANIAQNDEITVAFALKNAAAIENMDIKIYTREWDSGNGKWVLKDKALYKNAYTVTNDASPGGGDTVAGNWPA